MDVREMGWEGMDWMHLAQDRDQWRAVVTLPFYFTDCKGESKVVPVLFFLS
jgi:hypothetical protein